MACLGYGGVWVWENFKQVGVCGGDVCKLNGGEDVGREGLVGQGGVPEFAQDARETSSLRGYRSWAVSMGVRRASGDVEVGRHNVVRDVR
jgi:hypothetical protein